MTTYYCKDSKVYSSKKTSIFLPREFSSFLEHNSEHEKNSKEKIFSILEEYKNKGVKEHYIYGVIPNYSKIIESLEKSEKKEPAHDDYNFLEITSQPMIIQQLKEIITQVDANFPPQSIIKELDDYEHERVKKEKDLERELEKIQEQLNKQQVKYDHLCDEEIHKKKNRNQKLLKDISNLKEKQKNYEKLLQASSKKYSKSSALSSIEKEIGKLTFEKETISFDIELLRARLKTLKNEKKLGIRKKVSPSALLLTLGIIYWTKYATINQQITSTHLKILKKEEKISHIKKKIFILEHKQETQQEEYASYAKQLNKEQETLVNKIEEIEQQISGNSKEIKTLEKELEKAHKQLEPIKEEISLKKEKEEKITSEIKKLKITTKEHAFDIIKEIEENHKKLFFELEEIEKQLEQQTISFSGEGKIEIK